MRKKITLLTLFALGCITYSAMAQSTERVEMKSRVSRERYDEQGNMSYVWENEYWDNYYYNKDGKNVLYTQYMMEPNAGTKVRLYEQNFYEYNQAGQLIKEHQQYLDYAYEYDGDLLIKKSQLDGTGEVSTVWEYSYNNDKQLTEELEKNNGTLYGKTVYRYNPSKKLSVKLKYESQQAGLVVKDSIVYTYDKDEPSTCFTYRYPADGATEPFEEVFYKRNADGTLMADSIYKVDDFDGGTEMKPIEKNEYYYNGEGKLTQKKSFSYNPDTKYFSIAKREENYSFSKVGAGYVVTNFKAAGTDKPGAVKLSFTAPTQTVGLQEYRIMVDGELKDELVIDKSKTEYVLEGQARGDHSYYLVSVYNNIPANISEEANYSVEIDLPMPTNIKLLSYENTLFGWKITAGWDKVAIPANLHFKNYDLKVIYPTYENSNPTETNRCDFTYYGTGDNQEMEIQVAAVYEEGTSDYVTFKKVLSSNSQLTIHWQNSEKTVKSASGTEVGSIHYYYTANGDNEKLYAEIEYDGEGNPKGKTTQVIDDMGTLKAIMHYGWDGNGWAQDQKITYNVSDETYKLESKITYTADEKGTFNVVAQKEAYTYDDGACGTSELPAKTEYMKPDKDGNLVVSSVAMHTYVPSSDWTSYDVTDSLYAADGKTLTGKIERDYITSNKGMTKQNVYTYKENAFVPVSKLWTEFSEDSGLPMKETTQEYKNNAWADKQIATFTASSAYHAKRVISNVKATNANGKITLAWDTPARTDSLESYKILINDVEKETVPATTLTAEYANLDGGYTYRFRVVGVFKGMESTISGESSVKVAVPAYATIKALKEGYNEDYTGLVSLTGEALVTGVIAIGMSNSVYIEDETGALNLGITGTSPFEKGDKVSNLKGYLEVLNGFYMLTAESPSETNVVSEGNTVTPVVKTAAELKTSYEADQSKYIKVEDAKFEMNDTEIVLIQNEESLKLYPGFSGIDPTALNGRTVMALGHVTIEQDGYGIMINEASDISVGISTATADTKLYYANGEVVAEGADLVEVFDVAGSQLGVSNEGRISVSHVGTLIVKATYNGEVKISKIAVK